jgi:EmrB/QacA subfamily drug resistance transporter
VNPVTTSSAKGKLILFATILASGMAFLDGSVVNIAIPAIQSSLHATISGIQWVINGYMLMLCALILISGALGDRYGRKRIFTVGIGIFVLASFLCSVAGTISQLALFRALQGIGGAMMIPGSLSIINTSFAESHRGRAIGIWSGFAGGVAAMGPFLGGWLVQTLGWPSIFYINLPLGLLAFILTLRFIPESRNTQAKSVDFLGAVLLFFALLSLAYGLISGSDVGWSNPLILLSLSVGVMLFLVFLYVQAHVKEPLVPFAIFKSKLVTGANLVTFFLYFALSGMLFLFVLNLQQIQHYDPIYAGIAVLPPVLLITFLSEKGGVLADKIGPRLPMIVGPFWVGLGMTILALTGKHANYWIHYFPGLILFGLGMSLTIAALTKSSLAVDEKYSGAASGVNNAVTRISSLLAVALLGAIALSIFQTQLHNKISASGMNTDNKQQIMAQENKFSGIEVPKTWDKSAKNQAQGAH